MKKYIFRCVIQALVAVILLINLVQVKAQAEDANYFNSVGDDSDYSEFIYSYTSIPPTYIPVSSTESNAIDASVTSPDSDLNGIDPTTGNDPSSSADVDQYTSTGSNVWRGGTTTVQRERESSPTVLAHTTRQAPQITSTHIEEQTTIISAQPANLTTSHITRNTTKIVYTTTVSTIKLTPEVKTQTTVQNEPNITSSTSNTVSYRGGFASTPPNNEGVWNVDNFPFDFDFGHADIDTTPDTTTTGDIIFIFHAPFSAFFDANWRWFLIGVIVVLLIFILPGMIIQVYCNKFYHSYKREKHGNLELGTVATATGTMDAAVLPSVATSNNETCSTVGGEHEKIEPPFEHQLIQSNDVRKSDVIPNMTEPKHYDDKEHPVVTYNAPQNDVYSTIQSKTHQHDKKNTRHPYNTDRTRKPRN
uniref:Uncharacterized protein n=1 Tax=Ciona savignyi TaxID=51511 RepID=H2Y5B1_CIOSA